MESPGASSTGSSSTNSMIPEHQKALVQKINQKHAAIKTKAEEASKSIGSIKELSDLVIEYVGNEIYQGCQRDDLFINQVGSDAFKAKYLNHAIPAIKKLSLEKQKHFLIGEEIKIMEAEVKQLEADKVNNTLLPAELFRLIANLEMKVDASRREVEVSKREIEALKARKTTTIPYLSVVPTANTSQNQYVNWNGVATLTASHFRVEPADQTTITILQAGVYQITARLGQTNSHGVQQLMSICLNGGAVATLHHYRTAGGYIGGELTDLLPLAANDKIKILFMGHDSCVVANTKLMITYLNSP